MRVLLLENDDSFTWNIVETLPVPRERVRLLRGSLAREGDLDGVDLLVIGSGPTDPLRAGLVGIVGIAASRRLPTLGICLGHQAIGLHFGARLGRATPAHGKPAVARFSASRWLPGIEGAVEVMRYHSLALADVASPLRVTATNGDGMVMAVEHERLPMVGLQFHPDSHGTPRGREIVAAFLGAVE